MTEYLKGKKSGVDAIIEIVLVYGVPIITITVIILCFGRC